MLRRFSAPSNVLLKLRGFGCEERKEKIRSWSQKIFSDLGAVLTSGSVQHLAINFSLSTNIEIGEQGV